MMLDITFYGKNGVSPATIEFSNKFYETLIKSDFAEIGKVRELEIVIDEEKSKIEAIDLEKGTITNRQRLIDFLKESIVQESLNMLEKLGDSPSKQEYKETTSTLRIFQEILKCLKNREYCYLTY
ncbi:MAG: hypothetical protein HEQ13_22350 [Dolichospermum sp. DEX189]|uniref:Uncharacterized protein n=3 Tax=Cyanophyceae TaxID=3028117 RepID=A0ACC7S1U2_DOLFA|nr:hypothetical protein [Aphanizomenon flos-aquae FACHB-1040]MBO1063947.1 hypothetical protein [Anabaena sp. 54]MBO1071929.1 hypothetical protein [Dolichospermum sp. DEX189]MTJ42433.1 hypothetical protein [Dolichospermum flos-aquae UHCC 0037]QSV74147.1 MAG: hypothetical protein HEQ20_03045 [Aphanizomenon flos-aquae KM1D3_PB]